MNIKLEWVALLSGLIGMVALIPQYQKIYKTNSVESFCPRFM